MRASSFGSNAKPSLFVKGSDDSRRTHRVVDFIDHHLANVARTLADRELVARLHLLHFADREHNQIGVLSHGFKTLPSIRGRFASGRLKFKPTRIISHCCFDLGLSRSQFLLSAVQLAVCNRQQLSRSDSGPFQCASSHPCTESRWRAFDHQRLLLLQDHAVGLRHGFECAVLLAGGLFLFNQGQLLFVCQISTTAFGQSGSCLFLRPERLWRRRLAHGRRLLLAEPSPRTVPRRTSFF